MVHLRLRSFNLRRDLDVIFLLDGKRERLLHRDQACREMTGDLASWIS